MKGTRYTQEQIVGILKEVQSGRPVGEVCRQYGVSEATVYLWKKKFGGLVLRSDFAE